MNIFCISRVFMTIQEKVSKLARNDYAKRIEAISKKIKNETELHPTILLHQYMHDIEIKDHDEFIQKLRTKLLNDINTGFNNEKGNRIYNTLIYLAKWKPLNNLENGKPVCPMSLCEIKNDAIVTLSTGYRFDLDFLLDVSLEHKKPYKMTQNFMTRKPLSKRDINRYERALKHRALIRKNENEKLAEDIDKLFSKSSNHLHPSSQFIFDTVFLLLNIALTALCICLLIDFYLIIDFVSITILSTTYWNDHQDELNQLFNQFLSYLPFFGNTDLDESENQPDEKEIIITKSPKEEIKPFSEPKEKTADGYSILNMFSFLYKKTDKKEPVQNITTNESPITTI